MWLRCDIPSQRIIVGWGLRVDRRRHLTPLMASPIPPRNWEQELPSLLPIFVIAHSSLSVLQALLLKIMITLCSGALRKWFKNKLQRGFQRITTTSFASWPTTSTLDISEILQWYTKPMCWWFLQYRSQGKIRSWILRIWVSCWRQAQIR